MSKVFYIENTDGTISFKLAPGTYDGPSGGTRTTDLRLYGLGFMEWGEGVDENFLRVAENFACEEKVSGDPDFDPDNILPKDERDLGFGQGINYPVNGQTWFNTTRKQVFVYDNPDNEKDTFGKPLGKWIRVGASSVRIDTGAPTDPDEGDLWYDISYTDPSCTPTGQLKIWTGIDWVSVAERYVSKAGDTMCGFLTLHSQPIDIMHAATKGYVDSVVGGVGGFVRIPGDTMTGFLTLHAPPIQPMHAATKGYVDTSISGAGFVLKSGDIMNVGATLVLGRDPIDSMDAVTKRYVDSVAGGAMVDPVKIGTIVPYTGATAPENWLLCHGQAVSRTEYGELFGVIGTTYGTGDGSSTFNVPDLRGRAAVGLDNMGGTSANVITDPLADTLGGKFGSEVVTLTSAQVPNHTHTGTTSTAGAHTHSIPAQSTPAVGNGFHNATVATPTGTFVTPSTGDHTHTLTINSTTGGGGSHPNVQPSFAANWIIKAKPEAVTIGGAALKAFSGHGVIPTQCSGTEENGFCNGIWYIDVTFPSAFASPPHVVVTPEDVSTSEPTNPICVGGATDKVFCYPTDITTTGFRLWASGSPWGTTCDPYSGWTTKAKAGWVAIGESTSVGGGGGTGDYVQRSGDTMYGDLTMINDTDINLARDPIDPMHAVTKQYVDNLIANIGGGGLDKLFSWGSFSTR